MTYLRLLGLIAASYICLSVNATAHNPPPAPKALCEAKLENVITREFALTIDREDQTNHHRVIQELQNEKDRLTRNGRLPVSSTFIKGQVQLEYIGFLLARGNVEQILPLAREGASLVDSSYEALIDLGKYIVEMQRINNRSDEQSKALVDAELLFMAHSKVFGDNYGLVKYVMELLENVAAGKGVNDMGTLPMYDGQVAQDDVELDLTTETAKKTAKGVLKMWTWNGFSSTAEIRNMFANNHYALKSKLEKDIQDLKRMNSWWRRGMNTWAQVLIGASDKIPFVPEKYRQIALRLLGLQADQFMKDLYTGKIQELVGISRAIAPDGRIVLVNDKATIDKLLKTVEDMAAASIGNDLLTTYARTRYFANSWSHLLKAARARAKEDSTYQHLVTKLEAAEKARTSAGDLPYLYEPDRKQELTLAAVQAGYLIAIEEYTTGGVSTWLMPTIQQFLQ
jgi:hypothetical protein